jgi:D-alanyl-D-alanine carboxypeptidase/D-alanyl-D-alanine-endopeptidase (penicillin-binding protein 4)
MNLASLRLALRINVACLVLAMFAAAPVHADEPTTATVQQLASAIDAQIDDPRFASASWGIAVVSLDTGRTLYAHDARRLLQTASTAKLYTAALVLDTIGTDYRIPTQLLVTRPVAQGRLEGPLILRGMGDPSLGTAATNTDWADQLAEQLAASGVHDVQGDLVADDSYFQGPQVGAGWEARDLQSWFAVPASALSVQENVVALTLRPAGVPGHAALLTFDPAGAMPHVANHLTTAARDTRSAPWTCTPCLSSAHPATRPCTPSAAFRHRRKRRRSSWRWPIRPGMPARSCAKRWKGTAYMSMAHCACGIGRSRRRISTRRWCLRKCCRRR